MAVGAWLPAKRSQAMSASPPLVPLYDVPRALGINQQDAGSAYSGERVDAGAVHDLEQYLIWSGVPARWHQRWWCIPARTRYAFTRAT